MKPATLVLLAGLTVIVIAGALYSRISRVQSASGIVLPDKLYPDLGSPARANSVASIEIAKGKEVVLLTRQDTGWVLSNRGGYPVDVEKVKQTVMAVANLKVLEAKTRNAEQYDKLDLQDPKEGAPSARVTMKDSSGGVLAALIVGKTNWSGKPSVYVRKLDDPQSYQCQGEVKLEDGATAWIKKDILKIDRERIRAAEIAHADGEVLRIKKSAIEDVDFAVLDIPPTRELTSAGVAGPIGTALTWIAIEDVTTPAEVSFENLPVTRATYHTFDGLVLELKLAEKDGKTYAMLVSSWEEPTPNPAPPESQPAPAALAKLKAPDAVKVEIGEINKLHQNWVYVLPTYKATSIIKRMSDLLVALPTPAAPEVAPLTGTEPSTPVPPDHEH
jgi:hypothetical protein